MFSLLTRTLHQFPALVQAEEEKIPLEEEESSLSDQHGQFVLTVNCRPLRSSSSSLFLAFPLPPSLICIKALTWRWGTGLFFRPLSKLLTISRPGPVNRTAPALLVPVEWTVDPVLLGVWVVFMALLWPAVVVHGRTHVSCPFVVFSSVIPEVFFFSPLFSKVRIIYFWTHRKAVNYWIYKLLLLCEVQKPFGSCYLHLLQYLQNHNLVFSKPNLSLKTFRLELSTGSHRSVTASM